MTHPNLVLISNSEPGEKLAERAKNCVLVLQSGKIFTAKGTSIDLPNKHFLLRQNIKGSLDAWHEVIEWLRSLGGKDANIVIDYDHPLRELMLVAQAKGDFSYGLFLANPIERVSVPEYAILGSAACIIFDEQFHIDSLTKNYVGAFVQVAASPEIATTYDACVAAQKQQFLKDQKAETTQDKPKRVLLISYFSGPCRTVGVQRINYWSEEIVRLSGGDVEVHLATAIEWQTPAAHVHYVPDQYIADLIDEDGAFLDWAPAFYENESVDAKHFNTLTYYWRFALERYFEKLALSFDVVVISGNPFAVFDFAAFAKRKWYAKVFLDYRDPFANNPRMKYSETARDYAKFVERGYNFQSDLCIAVNDMCLDYLEGKEDVNTLVVPNGYDERAFQAVAPRALEGDQIKFVHAGSFYYDRSPRALITNLDPTRHAFHHVGNTSGIDEDILQTDGLVCHGIQAYSDTLSLLGGGDCGVVYVSETGFETPTKLYEYLAFGLDILICTHGPIKAGALASVLQDHPGVFWCENSDEGIQTFLKSYVPTPASDVDNERFTRRHTTGLLIDAIRG